MKYSMVKQFSNQAIDNAFKFIFKWVDFGKLLLEVLLGFIDIWLAFFLIFYNFFMYFYYIFLFIVDRSTETTPAYFRKTRFATSAAPRVTITSGPNPIPAIFKVSASSAEAVADAGSAVLSKTASSVANAGSAVFSRTVDTASSILEKRPNIAGKAKRPLMRTILEFFADFFISIKNVMLIPIRSIGRLFQPKIKANDEDSQKKSKGKSLIDEYIKEYENKRKR